MGRRTTRKMLKKKIERNIKAEDILALLANRYGDPYKYVCAAEVSSGAGAANRRIDFMVMHCWFSESFTLEGFEIKISKSDLRRELQDPDKHACFFDEIDYYWMVAPDYVLDDLELLPKKWGVMKVVSGEDGKLELKIARKPLCLHDDKIHTRKCSRNFMASFIRAVQNNGIARANAWKDREAIEKEIRAKVEQEITNGARVVPEWQMESLERMAKVCEDLGISHFGWGNIGMNEGEKKQLREALNICDNIHRFANSLENTLSYLSIAKRKINKLVEAEMKFKEESNTTIRKPEN